MNQPTKKKRGRPRKNPIEEAPVALPTNLPVRNDPVPVIQASIIKELPVAPSPAVPVQHTPEPTAPSAVEAPDIKEDLEVNKTIVQLTEQSYETLVQLQKIMATPTIEETIRIISTDTLVDLKEKVIFPEREPEIKEFDALVKRLRAVYTYSLIMYQDAEIRACEEVKRTMESKDKTICDLQAALQQREEEFENIIKSFKLVERERDAATAETEAFRLAGRTDMAVTKKLEDFQKQLNKVLALIKTQ